MSLQRIPLSRCRNDEHFQFFTDFIKLVNSVGSQTLKVQPQIDVLIDYYNQEDVALKKPAKSLLTKKINEADKKRGELFRGLVESNRVALKHVNPKISAAAERMQVVFDTYGNITQKPVAEETSAVYNLLKDLTGNYEADLELAGLNIWYEALFMQNGEVSKLVAERDAEISGRTDLVLRSVRRKVDEAYNVLTLCIEAFAVTEAGKEDEPYSAFIHQLNTLIDRYNLHLALRKGHVKAKGEQPVKPAPAENPEV